MAEDAEVSSSIVDMSVGWWLLLTPANVRPEAECELASKGSRGCVMRSPCQLPAPCVPTPEEDKVSPEMLVGSGLVAELREEPSVPIVMLLSAVDTSECSITSPAVGMLLGS